MPIRGPDLILTPSVNVTPVFGANVSKTGGAAYAYESSFLVFFFGGRD